MNDYESEDDATSVSSSGQESTEDAHQEPVQTGSDRPTRPFAVVIPPPSRKN